MQLAVFLLGGLSRVGNSEVRMATRSGKENISERFVTHQSALQDGIEVVLNTDHQMTLTN